MSVPKFLQFYLPSYDISQIDLDDPQDKEEIITQILNYGDKAAVLWLFQIYSLKEIKKVVSHPRRGRWQPRALNYWTRIFEIEIPKLIYEVALFSLRPRPRLMKQYFNERLHIK